jgi:predicted CopG family antitoxin
MGKFKSTEKKTITLRSNVIEKLTKQAIEENRNFSNMVETAALEYLKMKNDNLQMM